MIISIFSGFNRVVANQSLSDILLDIKTGKYINEIEELRKSEEKSTELKKKLPAFTPSALFEGGRKLENQKKYNGLIVLDLDKLDAKHLSKVRELTKSNVFTHARFISPSGTGYKILVRTENEDQDSHEATFNRLADYYEAYLGEKVDRSGKDIGRLCFVSYDPDLYYNTESELFPEDVQGDDIISTCEELTKRHTRYENGNRNNYIFQFACNTNRYGVEQVEVISYATDKYAEFGFGKAEIVKAITSAYLSNEHEFATFATFATVGISDGNSPYLPEKAFIGLPKFLEEVLLPIKKKGNRERDVFFLSTLGVLSGIFSNIEGLYDHMPHSPALNIFIIAPPASGKGVMTYAKILGSGIHNSLKAETILDIKAYKRAKAIFDKDDEGLLEEPKKPKVRILYIPGNVSSAAVIDHLCSTGGVGIIIESEADSIIYSLNQDWGGFSHLICQAYHHESISSSRKGRGEFLIDENLKEVNRPKLAIIVTGTPGQVRGLVTSSDSGLFSRFAFYSYAKTPVWRDVSMEGGAVDLNQFYLDKSKELEIIAERFEQEHSFELTRKQWNKHRREMTKMLTLADKEGVEGLVSSATRLGVIAFRLAMIFSVLRHYDKQQRDMKIVCEDQDFNRALAIVKVLFEHANHVASTFSENKKKSVLGNRLRFFSALPDVEFTRAVAVKVAKSLGIAERTVDYQLKYMVETGSLLKVRTGVYKKK